MSPYERYALAIALVIGVSGLIGFLLGLFIGSRKPAQPNQARP